MSFKNLKDVIFREIAYPTSITHVNINDFMSLGSSSFFQYSHTVTNSLCLHCLNNSHRLYVTQQSKVRCVAGRGKLAPGQYYSKSPLRSQSHTCQASALPAPISRSLDKHIPKELFYNTQAHGTYVHKHPTQRTPASETSPQLKYMVAEKLMLRDLITDND